MRKTAITLLLSAVGASAGAQTMYDALRFSENDYAGTARTIAMGNAFTALGGDIGSLSLNPAGSAVAPYSQIVFSPGAAWSVNKTQGTLAEGETVLSCFNKAYRNREADFLVPSTGFTVNFDTHRSSGIKNVTIGFVANVTNTYKDGLHARGLNSKTSFASGMATMAYGFDPANLSGDNVWYDFPSDWQYILAYQSYMISPDADGSVNYAGVTENVYTDEFGNVTEIGLPGAVDQTFGRSISGRKYDCIFNLGLNISDVVYLGANLGLTSLRYSSEEYFIETPEEPSLFQTSFIRLNYNSVYTASGTGVYGKFGIIVTPVGGLRLGAAIQTPTATGITEKWRSSASIAADADNSGKAETPEGQYSYRLISPFRFNAGAAYTFGSFAVVSADYEICNYNSMMFREVATSDNSNFESANDDIRNWLGTSHMFRTGVEIRPVNQFAIRTGYGFTTAPEYFDKSFGNKDKIKNKSHRYSFGLGYSSKGSFFADLAFSVKRYADEYVVPYVTAQIGQDGSIVTDGEIPVIDYNLSPEILNRKHVWTAAVTFGFRF